MLSKALQAAAGNGISTVAVAEAIDFDGTNDYLSRSGLIGQSDSRTFTLSAWIYLNNTDCNIFTVSDSASFGTGGLRLSHGSGTTLTLYGGTSANSTIFSKNVSLPLGDTFIHVLASVDTLNSVGSIYINDISAGAISISIAGGVIDFTKNLYAIGANISANRVKGRLSNVFLDYTYRDLSVEANRRLFVTADLKPAADQAALNPILYLPMDDPTQPGLNAGTGGDFTLTGVVARSGRGPNQYNAPYSDLDGTADYLSRTTAPTGIADSKTFTISFCANPDSLSTLPVVYFGTSSTVRWRVGYESGGIRVQGYNSAGTLILNGVTTASSYYAVQRNICVQISVDLTDTAKRFMYINGVAASVTWATYTNDTIMFTGYATPRYRVGNNLSIGYHDGRLGNVFFDTKYIDLSVPANLAKFVTGTGIDAKPVDLGANGELPTGSPPLIYLPMYGNNAGKNYGTGGDFTVNSGPYTGARGPNEYWGNKADFDGSTGYLSRTSALSGVSDGKTFSFSYFLQIDATGDRYFALADGTTTQYLEFRHDGTTGLTVFGRNAAGTAILSETAATAGVSVGNVYHVCGSYDMNNQSLRRFYVNGVGQAMTVSAYTNDTLKLTAPTPYVGRSSTASTTFLDGKLSEFYFTTDYIDFSQEANRLKFRDAFGNPVDLTQQIEDAAIPNPAIYMRFDPASFGTNSGTGGDFTVNGTITDGGNL